MSIWTEPSPSDFDRWEQLVAQGQDPSTAAKQLDFTGSSAFKRADVRRHAEVIALWHDVQRVEDRVTARDTLREIATDTGAEAKDRIAAAVPLAKSCGYLGDNVHVEVTGDGGGPVQIEGRAVVGLADVVGLARELGIGHLVGLDAADPRGELAATPDVLPSTAAR